jgi:hypothetical protein
MKSHTTNVPRLGAELHAQIAETAQLVQSVHAQIRGLGYGE